MSSTSKFYKVFILVIILAINTIVLAMGLLIHCKNIYNTFIEMDSNNNVYLVCDDSHLYTFTKKNSLEILLVNKNILITTHLGAYHRDKNNEYYVIIYVNRKYLLTDTTIPVKVIYDNKILFKVLF